MPDVEILDIGAMQCTPSGDVVERIRANFDLPGFIHAKPVDKR
jgi:hypothetical protein